MNDKRLSIIIPTIGRTVLDKTIESVLQQDVMPYEIVIWDNSGDGRAYEQSQYKDHPSLKWCISENKKDIINSWNSAVERSSGEYVYILGDDDLLLPGFTAQILQNLNRGAKLIHTPVQVIDPEDNIIDNEWGDIRQNKDISEWEFLEHLHQADYRIMLGSLVFSRADYEQVGRFKNIVMNGLYMDILFHLDLLFLHKKITVLAAPVWQYRYGVSDWSGSLKSKEQELIFAEQCLSLYDYFKSVWYKEHKKIFGAFVHKILIQEIVIKVYAHKRWKSLTLLFYKNFDFLERYRILKDLFYLARHRK